jgi:hypothetical protein
MVRRNVLLTLMIYRDRFEEQVELEEQAKFR